MVEVLYLVKEGIFLYFDQFSSIKYLDCSEGLTFYLSGGNKFNWTKLVEEKKHKH